MVPQFQLALGIDHGHALGQVVDGALQQARLLRQGLFAAQGFVEFDLGDIGVEDHQPALAGRPLTDLHPAPVLQAKQARLALLAQLRLHHQAGELVHTVASFKLPHADEQHIGTTSARDQRSRHWLGAHSAASSRCVGRMRSFATAHSSSDTLWGVSAGSSSCTAGHPT